jgi:hypothetical protein
MSRRRIEVVPGEVDGRPVVMVDPEDFDALKLCRRQLGAQQTRNSKLTRDLHVTAVRLAALDTALGEVVQHLAVFPCTCAGATTCARCAARAVLARVEPGATPTAD